MSVFLRWCPTSASATALLIMWLTIIIPGLPQPLPGLSSLLLGLTILAVTTLLIDVHITRRGGTRLSRGDVFGVLVATIAAAAVLSADFILWSQRDYAGANIGVGFIWLLGMLFLPIGALIHLFSTPPGTPARGVPVWGRRVVWTILVLLLAYLAYPFLPLGG